MIGKIGARQGVTMERGRERGGWMKVPDCVNAERGVRLKRNGGWVRNEAVTREELMQI